MNAHHPTTHENLHPISTRADLPRRNSSRAPTDAIELVDANSDEFGWPYALLLGTDETHGWSFECDMQQGALTAALTPAGQDAMLLITARQTQDGPSPYQHTTTATVAIDGAEAAWDPQTRILTVWNAPEAPQKAATRERLNAAAPDLLTALRELTIAAEAAGWDVDSGNQAILATARAAIAKAEGR